MIRYLVDAWVRAPAGGDPRVTGTYYGLQVDAESEEAAVAAVRARFPGAQIRRAHPDLVIGGRVIVLNSFKTED